MRIWEVPTRILCRKHLLGEHVECHMFVGTINKNKSIDGYIKNNLLNPIRLKERHTELVQEMLRRGYSHHSPLKEFPEQVLDKPIDTQKSLYDLVNRCETCKKRALIYFTKYLQREVNRMNIKQLKKTANELNHFLALDKKDCIDIKSTDEDYLQTKIIEAGNLIADGEQGLLSEQCTTILQELKVDLFTNNEDNEQKEKQQEGEETMEEQNEQKATNTKNKGTTQFGSKMVSQTGQIDLMVIEGTTMTDLKEMLMTKFNIEEKKAVSRIKGHLNHLRKKKGANITQMEDGTITLN